MTDQRTTESQPQQPHKSVFQASKAEIAREMKSRLYLGNATADDRTRIDLPYRR